MRGGVDLVPAHVDVDQIASKVLHTVLCCRLATVNHGQNRLDVGSGFELGWVHPDGPGAHVDDRLEKSFEGRPLSLDLVDRGVGVVGAQAHQNNRGSGVSEVGQAIGATSKGGVLLGPVANHGPSASLAREGHPVGHRQVLQWFSQTYPEGISDEYNAVRLRNQRRLGLAGRQNHSSDTSDCYQADAQMLAIHGRSVACCMVAVVASTAMTAFKFKVGELQASGLEIYVFDPAVHEGNEAFDEPHFPGSLEANVLTVTDPDLAFSILTDAANSADDSGDAKVRDAMTSLATRVLRKSSKYAKDNPTTPSGRATVDQPKAPLIGFMKENRERIEKATGLEITQPNEKPLGCGGFGCAYATTDKRWIVKISKDATEAALVKTVMDMRAKKTRGDGTGPSTAFPGVAFFQGVWMRPDSRGTTMFVLVRENVQPFEDSDLLSLDWFGEKGSEHPNVRGEYGTTALNLAQNFAHDFYEAKDDKRKADKAIDGYIKWMEVVRKTMPLVADTMEEFLFRGVVLRDVHDRNVGYSLTDWGKSFRPKGSVVIFDLGYTPTKEAKGFRKLNPALSAQQLAKLEGRGEARTRGPERAVIETSRSPIAPLVVSRWAGTVQIPRL